MSQGDAKKYQVRITRLDQLKKDALRLTNPVRRLLERKNEPATVGAPGGADHARLGYRDQRSDAGQMFHASW